MKIALSFAFFFILHFSFISQYTYKFKIVDTRGHSKSNVVVKAVNNSIVIEEKTNSLGQATFTLTETGVYSFSYLEMENVASFTVREGARGSGSKTVCYDPEKIFETESKKDRTGLRFKEVASKKTLKNTNNALVILKVVDKRKVALTGIKIVIVSCKDQIKYTAKSDSKGEVKLYLPVKQTYEVDLYGLEAYKLFNIGNFPNGRFKEYIFYEPTIIKEKIKDDTITQSDITQRTGTSTHKLYELKLKDYTGNSLSDEPVYLKDENGPTVYQGTTNKSGFVKFLVKKGTSYIVNLKYEQGIDLLDAEELTGFSLNRVTRRYRGSKQIEEMKAELKRQAEENARGYVTKHSETPIRVAQQPESYLRKTAKGFDIDFKKSGPIGTPTVINDKLYSQEGFYSPNFYCLDAKTGNYLWGVELGESGISPIVHQNGVLLINTYSCTLYAIDANNGKLLWSKWLAGTIYSTPSADNESVYVVYNNGGTNPKDPGQSHVLASFNLQTGNINWINWVDKEVISCPVIDNGEVHLASQSGNYYVFNAKTGAPINTLKDISAITSPTITEKYIYLTAGVKGNEKLTVLDRNTYKVITSFSEKINASSIFDSFNGAFGTMNFNGSKPIVYNNEVIILFDSTSVSAFDLRFERFIWRKNVRVSLTQIPVVMNDKIVVGNLKGELVSYDIKTGENKILEAIPTEVTGQPISQNKMVYLASGGVLSIVKTLYDHKFNQWNKDASHNTYWK